MIQNLYCKATLLYLVPSRAACFTLGYLKLTRLIPRQVRLRSATTPRTREITTSIRSTQSSLPVASTLERDIGAMASRPGLRFSSYFARASRTTFKRPLGRRYQTTDAAAAPGENAFARIWNSPVGLKTVHFWCGIVFCSVNSRC